ncbi:STT3 domain-containing protein [Salarchaeum sp. JOR-1]|uniref:STT3 domain-containing protein n=1 Tax=Salarchaeum sp. JOR-1 TaxID=2599399 RepID=UPI001198A178|nr:STT3 domain-containing protein [Salarchaeum sp. JOR-1]QDX40820.1 hypothetical protein FQU85_07850 [Salarchaeum sp. JOR-1]
MADVRDATDAFLDEHPDAEASLREVLTIDDRQDAWAFEDIPMDSGTFGELVSRNIAESTEDGYELADPAAVQAALEGDAIQEGADESKSNFSVAVDGVWRRVEWRVVGALLGALALVVAFRLFSLPAVFRGGDVVLTANDPYYYRYLVEGLLKRTAGPFDLRALSDLQFAVLKGEPLLVVTLWWIASLLGGGTHTAGLVLAWYPVVAAVLTGGVVYVVGTRLFADRRVGLASVVMLAAIPVHGFRTSLGFADHHAFDMLWLSLVLLGLVIVSTDRNDGWLRRREAWLGSLVLGFAVAGQTLAWDNSPILLAVIGLFVAVRVLADVSATRSPLRENLPLLAGLGVASVLTVFVHESFGWHTDQVAFAPALLLAGAVGVVGLATIVARFGGSYRVLGGVELVGAVVGWLAMQALFPEYVHRAVERVQWLVNVGGIAETVSLVGGEFEIAVIYLFGLLFFLGAPYVVWLGWRGGTNYRPAWLAVSGMGAYFFILSLIQIRFAGALAVPTAIASGLGFVHLAAVVDVTRRPAVFKDGGGITGAIRVPSAQTAGYLVVLFLLVGGLSFVQTPIKTSQLTYGPEQYHAADWMADDAADRDLAYPQNYVLSQWGHNRMYNYFVNGHSLSYGFAKGTYISFLNSTAGQAWYESLRDRVGYIVTTTGASIEREGSMWVRLHEHFGSGYDDVAGLSHYRAVWISDDNSLKVFSVVPGATIVGNATQSNVVLRTTVEVSGVTFEYQRQVPVTNGTFSVTVPYPGTYTVAGETVSVSETAVQNGTQI